MGRRGRRGRRRGEAANDGQDDGQRREAVAVSSWSSGDGLEAAGERCRALGEPRRKESQSVLCAALCCRQSTLVQP